ncbi:MAG: hypothetical protein Kow0029_27410 [Candidatus Rifleibacteriota bacterium]
MDEVPVANANPVNTIVRKPEKEQKKNKQSQVVVSLKNLVYMAPLAIIVLLQLFFLGKSFGTFSTFPYTSFSTFIFVASLAVFFFFLQMLMRSIIYSTLGGVIFLSGIFYSWFGDFYSPIIENFSSLSSIVKAAWSKKDIPFPLLMSGAMTFTFSGMAFLQFFVSLFVKSFFETFFGKDWGDGNWMGFAGAIALIAGLHIGFYVYSSSVSNHENKFQWEFLQKYQPIEKYLTETPGAVMLSEDRIYSSHGEKIKALSLEDGKILESKPFKSAVIRSGFQFSNVPVFFSDKEMVCYNHAMNYETWRVPYPAKFPEVSLGDESPAIYNIPLTSFFINQGKNLLVFYDYGYVALYNVADGKQLWLKSIDRTVPVNRNFSSNFPTSKDFVETKESIIFSCQNGIVKAIKKDDGSEIWKYNHPSPKYNGKAQRGFLTQQNEKLLASFKTGELVTLDIATGKVIYTGKNEAFIFHDAPAFKGIEASFLTEEGFFYVVEVDGGRVLYSCNLLPNKLDFLPVITSLEHGIVAHKDEILKVENQSFKSVLKASNRIFVTRPVFDNKLMYIGTSDGWVFCIHTGSHHEKWRIHVNGELGQNSLAIAGTRLIVQTRSGSLISLDRRL